MRVSTRSHFLRHLGHGSWFVSDGLQQLQHLLGGVELHFLGSEHSQVKSVQTLETRRSRLVLLLLLLAGVVNHHLVEVVSLGSYPLQIKSVTFPHPSNCTSKDKT